MENRSPALAVILAAVLLSAAALPLPAAAESGPSEEQAADWQRRLDYAKGLQARAAGMREAASQAYQAREKECFRKFRVNDCRQEAHQEQVRVDAEARRIDNEGKALERQIKKEQLADKDARRIEEAPQREADLRERQRETAALREQSAAERADKLKKKEAHAAKGAERAAANEERLRKKREAHERKLAEKMEKTRRREAGTAP